MGNYCPCFGNNRSLSYIHSVPEETVLPEIRTNDVNNRPRFQNNNNNNVDESRNPVYRALYNYQARENNDLDFQRGDRLTILDRETGDWWRARSLTSQRVGLIPSNFVAIESDNVESQDWWFPCDRRAANKQLLIPGNPKGTFLIRKSKDSEKFALSIRAFGDVSEGADIKHYHIRKNPKGMVYVNRLRSFRNLIDLVAHYKDTPDGLCCRLTSACPKEPEMIPFKNLEVNRSDITLNNRIGSGKFGEVWKGRYKGKLNIAVKKLIPGKMTPDEFLQEAKMLHCMRHRRLVQLMGICTSGTPIYIVMEYLENGALIDYLKKDRGRKVLFKHILDMAAQIADGMSYLEQKNYIHRDLRAANILVGLNGAVKVADFGLARLLHCDTYQASPESQFPVKWTAPEAAELQSFTIKSDVWSYGILLYELVTYGEAPYKGINPHVIIDKLNAGYRLENPDNSSNVYNIVCPTNMYKKMLECWDDEPKRRPTFANLATFFDDYYSETEEQYLEET